MSKKITHIRRDRTEIINFNDTLPIHKDETLEQKDIDLACSLLDCIEDQLYFNPFSYFKRNFYFDGIIFHAFTTLKEIPVKVEMSESIGNENPFFYVKNYIEKLLEDKKFSEILSVSDTSISIHVYQNLFPLVPDEDKVRLFIEEYVNNEFGFQQIQKEFIKEIFNYYPVPFEYSIESAEYDPKDGYYIIYRGEGEESTPLDNAYSWTLNKNIAKEFATRYDTHGIIHIGKVKKEDILAYINIRDEEEILLFPNSVIHLDKEEI